ncbi:DUF3168 domain-containing protein [Aminipila butyrica]|uniref:DUF3168 domain-containing protein n=1 Tax=Aminipila butyrica TaxID=433296 RepID=A0A858BV11_9FIRM|nr:DUF3168 domain-containing protein [Aminipila butyrica]QIB68614.1 DUF3168 domain-containing protein [Aminipila butyrica]
MEKELRYELEKAIPELAGNIYPTNAPEASKRPYIVYTRVTTQRTKTLEGYTSKQALSYMFSIMATKYADMKALAEQVEAFLIALPGKDIGKDEIHVEDVKINNISETYEFELKVNRGILDFTIYF